MFLKTLQLVIMRLFKLYMASDPLNGSKQH